MTFGDLVAGKGPDVILLTRGVDGKYVIFDMDNRVLPLVTRVKELYDKAAKERKERELSEFL